MSVASQRVWIGLGSNLQQPILQLQRALRALGELPATRLLRRSSFFISPPMGPQDQPDFVNAVAELETRLEPLALLDALQELERRQQRCRTRHWGERTLDLDLLVYGEQRIHHPRLTVPHPGIPQRAFVLYPLGELAPALQIPGMGTVATLLARLPLEAVARRLDDADPQQ